MVRSSLLDRRSSAPATRRLRPAEVTSILDGEPERARTNYTLYVDKKRDPGAPNVDSPVTRNGR